MQDINTINNELCHALPSALFIVSIRPLCSGVESNDSCVLVKRFSRYPHFVSNILNSLKHLRRGTNSTQTACRFHLVEEGTVRVPTPRLLLESVFRIVSFSEEFRK